MESKANITINAYIYNSIRSEILLASESYQTITFLMALPLGQPLTPFERLIKPFHHKVWMWFSSSLIIAIVCIFVIRFLGRTKLMDFIYGHRNRRPLTNLLSTLFGGALYNYGPVRNFARYLLTLWLLYTFVLRAAYSGELFTILQDGNSHNNMKTLEEVARNNYSIYAFGTMADVIRHVLPHGNIVKLIDGEYTLDELFARVSEPNTKEKIGLCTFDYIIQYYNQLNPTRRVKKLAQSINTSPLVFYMPRHSFLKLKTSSLIMQMIATGVMKRIKSVGIYAPNREPPRQKKTIRLTMKVLLGIFFLYGAFVVICILVFILEVVSKKSRCITKALDFVNF